MAGDIPNEAEAPAAAPQSATVQRLNDRRDGRYLIAPDSAEPLPPGIWTRGDYDAVVASADAAAERWAAADAGVAGPARPSARHRLSEPAAGREPRSTEGVLARVLRLGRR